MKNIWLLTILNGEVVIHKHAKAGVDVMDICEIAENEVNDGYADYARVTVDGEAYMEIEA